MPVADRRSDADLIVIGSGLGGLCCGALAARYGLDVIVLEAHDRPGGAAHGFQRRGFHFESGPSLWSGLGRWPSSNPLAQVLRAVGETVPVVEYRDWGVLLPEGNLRIGVGNDDFLATVTQLRGDRAAREWLTFMDWLRPYSEAANALPLLALRDDPGLLGNLLPLAGKMLPNLGRMAGLGGAFGPIARRHLSDPFLLHWIDLLCFLISGLDMDRTNAAAMATLFGEWFRPDACLEYPLGGSAAVAEALVRGLEKHGGQLQLRSRVDEILVSDGRARGVRLADGRELTARRAVVSNASIWDTLSLLPEGSLPERWRSQRAATPACAGLLPLHLGLRGDDLAHLPLHHVWVGDWERGITAERNMVVLSMPSLLQPELAPAGHHVLHGYTPANEPWELWQDLEPGTPAYDQRKQERCQVFWQALERIIPDARERAVITLEGTPRTQQRYLNTYRGSYGPALGADQGLFPGIGTPVPNLKLCGASVFPGIGVPPVATSGAMAAHSLVDARQQRQLLRELELA